MPEPGKAFFICLTLAATVSLSVAADFTEKNKFSAALGGEYQFISQEYYNAILDTTQFDVLEIWQLDQDEINDMILRTSLKYNFLASKRSVNLIADLEVSGDRLLGRSEGFFRLGDYNNQLRLSAKFEAKSPSGESKSRFEEYAFYHTDLSGRQRLSELVSVNFKTGYEAIFFSDAISDLEVGGDSLSGFQVFPNYNYSLLSGRIGADFRLSEFTSELSWRAGFNHRAVPDSGEAGYDQFRFDLEYTYVSLSGIISLQSEFELRDYNQPLGRDDFSAFGFQGHLSRSFGNPYEVGFFLFSDVYRFDSPDILNRNYALIRMELEGTVKVNSFGWGPLVKYEVRHEKAVEDLEFGGFSESYRQWELGVQAEFLDHRELFFDGEATYGRRNYREEEGFLSSYNLWSVSLIAGYSVFKNLALNFMFDGLFESHQIRENNTNLYLLSIGVTARI